MHKLFLGEEVWILLKAILKYISHIMFFSILLVLEFLYILNLYHLTCVLSLILDRADKM
jgi:hypothetical protein